MADFDRIYNTIAEEFDNPTLALMVVQIYTINLTTKVKPKDIINTGRFTDKLIEKSKKVLWEYPIDDVDVSLAIYHLMRLYYTTYDDVCQALFFAYEAIVIPYDDPVAPCYHALASPHSLMLQLRLSHLGYIAVAGNAMSQTMVSRDTYP